MTLRMGTEVEKKIRFLWALVCFASSTSPKRNKRLILKLAFRDTSSSSVQQHIHKGKNLGVRHKSSLQYSSERSRVQYRKGSKSRYFLEVSILFNET